MTVRTTVRQRTPAAAPTAAPDGAGRRLRRLGRARTARTSGSGGSAGPVVTTGPNGERLVRTTKFAALGSIWSMNCSVSCTGVAI